MARCRTLRESTYFAPSAEFRAQVVTAPPSSGQAGVTSTPLFAPRSVTGEATAAPATEELLARLVGEGADAASCTRWRAEIESQGLARLSRRTAADWMRESRLEELAAERIEAAFRLGRRAERARHRRRPRLSSPSAVYRWIAPELRGLEQEVFWVLLLDAQHRLLEGRRISAGTLTSSLVHPREVFAPALRGAAASVVCVHNHPSGDPEPSAEDRDVTRRLEKAGALLGIPLLDHVVVGEARFVSLRDRR